MSLDGKEQAIRLKHRIDFLSSGFLYIAGHQSVAKVTRDQVKNNFEGIVNKFVFTNATYRQGIDFIDLVFVKPTRPFFSIHNNVVTKLSPDAAALETTETVTFNGREFLKLPRWDTTKDHFGRANNAKQTFSSSFYSTNASNTNNPYYAHTTTNNLNENKYIFVPFIEFVFSTHLPNSLLLYLGAKSGFTDYLVMEISDGLLHVVLDCGSGNTVLYRFNLNI